MRNSRFHLFRLLSEERFLFVSIIAITVFTRTFHLTYQSLWFDELYSICVANPSNSFSTILTDIKTDFHPPFYYFILNTVFRIFPYNDFVGRIISAIFGIMGVCAMYFLGKEIRNKRIGLLMAFLMSVSLYQIKHSQEVRMYILLSLLAIVSSLLFLKAIKKSKSGHFFLYTIASALMMYTHYYGFFVVLAHFLSLCHLLVFKVIDVSILKKSVFSYSGIFLLYLPWIPDIITTGGRHHFMEIKEPWYFFSFLYEYYGKEPLTTLLVLGGLFLFMKGFFRSGIENNIDQKISGIFILYGLIIIYTAPYMFSFYKPIINLPGTLSVLPFLIAAVVLGIDQFKKRTVNILMLIIFISNFINIAFINKYYVNNSKQNFRQITAKINDSNRKKNNAKIAVSQIADFYGYYFKQFSSDIKTVNPNEYEPAGVLCKVDCFYVINAPFTKEKNRQLEEIDELGFLILYPRISDSVHRIKDKHKQWVKYIDHFFIIDSVFLDDKTKNEVAFRYRRKCAL
ncbi:MAG: glycosyltransferase family 39 protein [Bacteroidota bacterium]